MTDFIIKKLPYDLTSNAGLTLVRQLLIRLFNHMRPSIARQWWYQKLAQLYPSRWLHGIPCLWEGEHKF